MEQYDLDQEIGISTTIKHTKRDLADAVALLVNAHVIDMDECRRLADMVDSAYPNRERVVLVEAPKGQSLEEWQADMAELRRRAGEGQG
tara:strand:+ start:215 stop:481 length:267 start_codon:yes stop_codon:yes gene_type:complete